MMRFHRQYHHLFSKGGAGEPFRDAEDVIDTGELLVGDDGVYILSVLGTYMYFHSSRIG